MSECSLLGWEKNFQQYILDPIYGEIGLTDIEIKLINSRTFSRLRNIKQLGFIHKIYPSATHTRFEHSIGTLFITWNMLKRIVEQLESENKTEILEILNDDDVIKAVRLAALLHDLGHGPFSHSFEGAMKNLGYKLDHDVISNILLTHNINRRYLISLKSRLKIKKLSNKVKASRTELSNILSPKLRELILCISDLDYECSFDVGNFKKIRYFLHELLKGDIGSDRIDYLLRDTYFTGLGHKFSLSEVLKNIYYIYDDVYKRLLLSILYKGKESIELLLLTRYFHYEFIANNIFNSKYEAELYHSLKRYFKNNNLNVIDSDEFKNFAIDVALSNDWIEKDLNIKEELTLIHSITLLQFTNFINRYYFYRIIEDDNLRKKFKEKIIEHINNVTGQNLKDKIYILFNIGKPRIPILHNYLKNYIIGKTKISVLTHDNSPLLISLGKSYVENTAMNIYATKDIQKKVQDVIYQDQDFYKRSPFLKQIFNYINTDNLNEHDYLLFSIFNLCDPNVNKTTFQFSKLINKYIEFKKRNDPKYSLNQYDYRYDPLKKISFPYPTKIYNSLILFEVCKFTNIEVMHHFKDIINGEEVFRPSYEIVMRRHRWIDGWRPYYYPLSTTRRAYSGRIQRILS